MKRTEKIICYVLMCVSSFSGMFVMGRRTECIGSIRIDAFIKISGAFSDDLRTYCYGWRRLFLYRKCKTDAVKAAVSEAAGDRILWSGSDRLSSAYD